MKPSLNDPKIDEFVNSQKKSTGHTYRSLLKNYLTFTKKSGEQLLEEKRNDKDFQVEKDVTSFVKWLTQETGKGDYYASSAFGAVRGFYAYNHLPLVFRKQESKRLWQCNRKTQDYLFDREDLSKIALAGNLKERYVLLVGK